MHLEALKHSQTEEEKKTDTRTRPL